MCCMFEQEGVTASQKQGMNCISWPTILTTHSEATVNIEEKGDYWVLFWVSSLDSKQANEVAHHTSVDASQWNNATS